MTSAKMTTATSMGSLLSLLAAAVMLLAATRADAAVPGITGPTFNLSARPEYITQPDGQMVYSWGYGCNGAPAGFLPSTPIAGATCPSMQVPGPTLIVTQNQTVTVTLTNNLPAPAGNTSILFPGFQLTGAAAATVQPGTCTKTTPATRAPPGLLTVEAAPGCAVTYTFTASAPGTRAYYSGTQGDLQIEMGLYGAIIVLPAQVPAACTTGLRAANLQAKSANSTAHFGVAENDYRLSQAAYAHAMACYDREYLFQFSEMDPNIHTQAQAQVSAIAACRNAGGTSCGTTLQVPTEPYRPAYFMINGRSMPDDMDPNYAIQYPHQPYNGNPHMHPGELVLLRIIGQGRWQHPFHEHGNHVRVLARDGNLIRSASDTTAAPALGGPLLFTTTTTPGQAIDGIFYWTGKGLNWDPYGHKGPDATLPCTADANGYNTANPLATNYFEWCQDHNKPVEAKPFGNVGGGGPVTLPDPNILANGPWYGGSPYLGPDAMKRAVGSTPIPPSGTVANPPTEEAGFAFMWHSHNEREITTNNIFPGGMLMMMLVDSREFVIDESL